MISSDADHRFEDDDVLEQPRGLNARARERLGHGPREVLAVVHPTLGERIDPIALRLSVVDAHAPLARLGRAEDDEGCQPGEERDHSHPARLGNLLGDLEAVREVEWPHERGRGIAREDERLTTDPLHARERSPDAAVLAGLNGMPAALRLGGIRAGSSADVGVGPSVREERFERVHHARGVLQGAPVVVPEGQRVLDEPGDVPSRTEVRDPPPEVKAHGAPHESGGLQLRGRVWLAPPAAGRP